MSWSHGGDASLEQLTARLRAAPPMLRKEIRVAIRVATIPARQAVKAELLAVMPKAGGLNTYLAASSIRSVVLTGPRKAGVVMRGSKRGHNLRVINRTGLVRHPVFGNRDVWATTRVPSGWWERALDPFGPTVEAALRRVMHAVADEAGFDGTKVRIPVRTVASMPSVNLSLDSDTAEVDTAAESMIAEAETIAEGESFIGDALEVGEVAAL